MLKLACLWISHRTNTTRRTPSKHLSPRTGLLTLHTHTHTVYPKRIAIGFDKSLVLHTLSIFLSSLSFSVSLFQVGGSVVSHHGSVCYRAGWLLLWCVYVQLHPGPPLYPLHVLKTLPQNSVHYQSTHNAQYSSGHQSQSWRTTVCFRSCPVLILRGQSHQQVGYSRS